MPRRKLGRKTVRSSNRIRAERAGAADMVRPGRRKKQASSVIDGENEEVYGVLLSERRRKGENTPAVPESKTKNTKSIEPKRTPRTGVAKARRT